MLSAIMLNGEHTEDGSAIGTVIAVLVAVVVISVVLFLRKRL